MVKNTFRRAALMVAPVMFLLAGQALADVCEGIENCKPGKKLEFSVAPAEVEERRPWRHLQRLIVQIREGDSAHKAQLLGCETSSEFFDCGDLETATKSDQPKGIKKIVSVTYSVYDDDYASGVKDLLDKALERTNKDESVGHPSTPVVVNQKLIDFPFTSKPACSQFAQPCYSRPVCTMYGACSKSTTSCVKCN